MPERIGIPHYTEEELQPKQEQTAEFNLDEEAKYIIYCNDNIQKIDEKIKTVNNQEDIKKLRKRIEYWKNEKYKTDPSLERTENNIVLNGGKEIKKCWDKENIKNYNLEEYVEMIKQSSGNYAVHAMPREDLFLQNLTESGYLQATGTREKKPTGYTAAVSDALHFSVNNVYWNTISDVGLFCSVEALLENKTFMDSPMGRLEANEDWPLRGLIQDTESEKFRFNELGILFIPKTIKNTQGHFGRVQIWEEELRKVCQKFNFIEEFFQTEGIILSIDSIPAEKIFTKLFEKIKNPPKRVYFYEADDLQEGILEFLKKYGIKTYNAPIVVSGNIVRDKSTEGKIMGGKGKGNFYKVI